jgi:hypothetical protein
MFALLESVLETGLQVEDLTAQCMSKRHHNLILNLIACGLTAVSGQRLLRFLEETPSLLTLDISCKFADIKYVSEQEQGMHWGRMALCKS